MCIFITLKRVIFCKNILKENKATYTKIFRHKRQSYMWIIQAEILCSCCKKSRRRTEGKSLFLEVLSANATYNGAHCQWTTSRYHFLPFHFSQIIFLISILMLSFPVYSLLQVGGHATAQAVSRRLLTAATRFDPRHVLEWSCHRLSSETFSAHLSVTFLQWSIIIWYSSTTDAMGAVILKTNSVFK